MKPNPDETFESWGNRVAMYERGRALQQLAQGEDPNKVIEEMSRRIMDKLLHPIYKAIRESTMTDYNSEESKAEYQRMYSAQIPKGVADHVQD